MSAINVKKLFFLSAVIFFGWPIDFVQAQSNDAVAIRVMPNNKHYSVVQWYQANVEESKQGSPAQLLVDGYEAIRDGRTVYINVGNVGNVGKKILYTNIYIMSYTQNADADTTDIFGQMLENWTFNTNLIEKYRAGKCEQIKNNQADTAGQLCYTDSDCGQNSGLYCDSAKAKITRDVRRLSDLRYIDDALKSYAQSHDNVNVQLLAGSYIKGRSLSVWPSWQETLGKILGTNLPTDPLNSLWGCNSGNDPAGDGTCWNEVTKSFDNGINIIPNDLKKIGRVYSYSSLNNGSSYKLCADNEGGNFVYDDIAGDQAVCFFN